MKKHLLITIFCLVPFLAFSQKKSIDGFLDIPFGSDSATVKAAIIAKGGQHTASVKDNLSFTGLSISGRKVLLLIVKFMDNKAYEADFGLNDFTDDEVLAYYDNFSADIAAVYGKGMMTSNFGDSKNTERVRRLKSGNVSCKTIWQSKNKNTIALTFWPVDRTLYILLQYKSTDLGAANAAKVRSDL